MTEAQDIADWIGNQAQESQTLEFKRADSLGRTDARRAELVKDATAMANGEGGRLVYGISESQVGAIRVADALDPITDELATREWITQVISDNTGPRMTGFRVEEFVVDGGRVIVVEVDQGATAHQSSLSHRYYQRIGTVTKAMLDFQIRDVMARRHAPVIEFDLGRRNVTMDPHVHEYMYTPRITNVGRVTLNGGYLEVDFPTPLTPTEQDAPGGFTRWSRSNHRVEGRRYERYGIPLRDLHPEQQIVLDLNSGHVGLMLTVIPATWGTLNVASPPVRWRVYSHNSQPLIGDVPFDHWCIF